MTIFGLIQAQEAFLSAMSLAMPVKCGVKQSNLAIEHWENELVFMSPNV